MIAVDFLCGSDKYGFIIYSSFDHMFKALEQMLKIYQANTGMMSSHHR